MAGQLSIASIKMRKLKVREANMPLLKIISSNVSGFKLGLFQVLVKKPWSHTVFSLHCLRLLNLALP